MNNQLPRSIRENMHFLVAEVDGQLSTLQAFFLQPTRLIGARIIDRAGYAYNLKLSIHTGCLNRLANRKNKPSIGERRLLRGVEVIATHLERISELSRDCVNQVDRLSEIKCLRAKPYPPMIQLIRDSIEFVLPALFEHDSKMAQKIGRGTNKLNTQYQNLYRSYLRTLKAKKRRSQDIVHAMFVAHGIEQMGDALNEISESIISANIGQQLSLEQYRSLHQSLGDLKLKKDDPGLQIEPLAYTRSGSAISGVSKDDDYMAVYKDGLKRKLKEERQGVENWHEIYPGVAPKILSYKKRGQTASLLIEHLPGQTFEQILLNESDKRLQSALDQLIKTLKSVWRETHSNKPARAQYMDQLQDRMSKVYQIHPEFRYSDQDICGLRVLSFDQLVKQASALEAKLPAPFSVYIHGDFNLDNIIYDPSEKKISFIDLHRSCYMDYVQDISVFMVSNYRLQILDVPIRRRIMSVAIDFYQRTRRTAKKAGDDSFDMRLALGLARSFASSTRFILDKSLARSMFLRARYLLEHSLNSRVKKTANYRLPIEEIFVV